MKWRWKRKGTVPDDLPLEKETTPLEKKSVELISALDDAEKEMQRLYKELAAAEKPDGFREEIEKRQRSYKRTLSDLLKASSRTAVLTDELSSRWREIKKAKKRKWIAAPPNTVIDYEEESGEHFAAGLNLYKLLLLCFVGSFIGVVIELIWCFVTRGYLESRSGLVYGPFNLLYGGGAVLLTVSLYRFRNRGRWLSFLGGMLVGSALEYFCSWGQELLFGSRSWDYSDMPFNLNGRICLQYSIYWGILGVLWVKVLYPWLARWILKIPNRAGKILVYAFTAFFLFNGIVTLLALYRWAGRLDAVPPSNAFFAFIDRRFPDARMERIFANMEF